MSKKVKVLLTVRGWETGFTDTADECNFNIVQEKLRTITTNLVNDHKINFMISTNFVNDQKVNLDKFLGMITESVLRVQQNLITFSKCV